MAFVPGISRIWRGHGGQLGDGGVFTGVHYRNHLDSRFQLFQFALSQANDVVRAGGNGVLPFVAGAGQDFRQAAGDFLGGVEIRIVVPVSRDKSIFHQSGDASYPGNDVAHVLGPGICAGDPLEFILW